MKSSSMSNWPGKIVKYISNCLAIDVPSNNSSSTLCTRVFPIGLIILNLAGFIHSFAGRYYYILPEMEMVFSVTDIAANIALTLFVTTSIALTKFVYKKEMKRIKILWQRTDILIELKKQSCSENEFFILFTIGILVAVSFDGATWTIVIGLFQFQFYFWRSIQFIYISLASYMLMCVVYAIKYRFEKINRCLRKSVVPKNDGKAFIVFLVEPRSPITSNVRLIREINKKYHMMYELVRVYNTVYGNIVLVLLCICVITILNNIDLLVFYNAYQAKNFGGVGFGWDMMVLSTLWIILSLVLPTLIAASCSGASKEAEKTATICFVLLNDLPTFPKTENDKIIREELILLSHQATARCPKFSAAGFFNVDYSILGFVLGTVTTYVIVILQFHSQS